MYYNLINSMSRGSSLYDADAQAFLTATGITDLTISNAINQLVLDLKSNSLWSKMHAIYPFVGGTAFTHKFNLKDPRDLDVAFRLQYYGGLTHSSTGVLPNGSTGRADTFSNIVGFAGGGENNMHLSFYSRTNSVAANMCEIGCSDGFGAEISLLTRLTGDLFYPIMCAGTSYPSVSNTNSTGFYIGTKRVSALLNGYKNGVKVINNGTTSDNEPLNRPISIFAQNNGGAGITRFSNRESAFATTGEGLTDTDASNLYTLVQAFQTTLGRNV